MKKVMLLAAMLAMVLAAAVPAFAQSATAGASAGATAVVGGSDDGQYNANAVCQNIIGSIGDITQTQSGDADAIAADDSAAAADVAQEQGVTLNQVNQCLNSADVDGDGFVAPSEVVVSVSPSASASASAPAGGGGGSAAAASPSASASAAAVLPETGGASLIALGAGALLVAGGLLARRIVR